MTHIVILFNRSEQELSEALSESKMRPWLNTARKTILESKSIWSKLDHLFDLKLTLDPQVLNVTPVRVELGMHDSQSHPLIDKNAIITDKQIIEFNDFFSGVFRLIKTPGDVYQLHFQQFLKFNLPLQFLPPNFSDYRVQIDAAGNSLKSHLTELQTWCFKQDLMWNAFYLWPRPKDRSLLDINLDDRSKSKLLSKLKIFHEGNAHAKVKFIVSDELSSLSFELMKMEQQFKYKKLEKLTISFTDNNVYQLKARDFFPWWKKIFSR